MIQIQALYKTQAAVGDGRYVAAGAGADLAGAAAGMLASPLSAATQTCAANVASAIG